MAEERPIILVVEDDEGLQRQLRWSYGDFDVQIAANREEALNAFAASRPPVVTLDLGLPPDPDGTSEGFAILEAILREAPNTKVIVASGHSARESALKAVEMGAYDFYEKPVDIDTLGLIVKRAFRLAELEAENRRLASEMESRATGGIVTAAPSMQKVCQMVERVAGTDASVMLLGASGTGKELLARRLHDASRRSKANFIAINCAAIPDNLLEAELFGYERGAFTGAVKTTEGKIELAQKGTLFLDEVGDIPLPLQVKLLRFLQERVIERIGGRKQIPVNVRIVAATHQDLDAMIAAGSFREDLYYRLAEIVMPIPRLADRPGDAALLARHFLHRFGQEQGRRLKGFSADALAALDHWDWPGNVRELENRVKRAVIMAEGPRITQADLDLDGKVSEPEFVTLREARETADKDAIRRALARTDGNITGAAKLLGISRPTFYDLVKQYDMEV